jgi:hypothetical protein
MLLIFGSEWMERKEQRRFGWLDPIWNQVMRWTLVAGGLLTLVTLIGVIVNPNHWKGLASTFLIGAAIGAGTALCYLLIFGFLRLEARFPLLSGPRGGPSILAAMLCAIGLGCPIVWALIAPNVWSYVAPLAGGLLGASGIFGLRWLIRRRWPARNPILPRMRRTSLPQKPGPRPTAPPSALYRRAQRQMAITKRSRAKIPTRAP